MLKFIDRNRTWVLILIPALSFLMHLHVFNKDLVGIHVWRQTQTQTVINNFYQDDMNILNPTVNDFNRTAKMEFPIMQWIYAVFHKVLGDSIIISRALTFLLGLLSIYGMYRLADTIFKNKTLAVLCAWTFNWSPVFYYYTLNPLPDNFALCCGIWMAVFFFTYIRSQTVRHLILSAVFLCFATLAKLPFVLYGILPITYLLVIWKQGKFPTREYTNSLLIFSAALFPAVAWYISVIPGWQGNGVLKGVLDNKEGFETIIDILAGNLISVLPELLINYGSVLFFLAGFYFIFKHKEHRKRYFSIFVAWGIIVAAYFFFELNMIALVHDYYLFPFLPLIFLIVAYGAYHLLNSKKWLKYITVLALIALPFAAFFRINGRWNTTDPGFNPVYYHHRDELRRLVPDDAICIVGNDESHFIALYYLDKKGFSFEHDWLAGIDIDLLCTKGAQYLFTDSRVDDNEDVKAYLDEKIFEKGTLRVYKLRCL